MKDRLFRYLLYFRKGHGGYLAFFIAVVNFVVIQYRLFIQYIPELEAIFFNMTIFLVSFILIYIPLSIILGWLDYKKISVPRETAIATEVNPYLYAVSWPTSITFLKFQKKILKKENLLSKDDEDNINDLLGRIYKLMRDHKL